MLLHALERRYLPPGRRPNASKATMLLNFNSLPQVTRHRFIEATRRPVGQPGGPLVVLPHLLSSGGWAFLFLISAGTAGLLAIHIFERVAEPLSDKSTNEIMFFGMGVALAVLGLLGLMTPKAVRRAYPYLFGTYIFPTAIVVAVPHMLKIYHLSDLVKVNITHMRGNTVHRSIVECSFASNPTLSFTLHTSNKDYVHWVASVLEQGKRTLLIANATRHFEPLRPLDPFFEAQMANFAPVNEPGPTIDPHPPWTRVRSLIALAVAAAATGGVVLVRVLAYALA